MSLPCLMLLWRALRDARRHDAEKDLRRSGVKLDFLRQRIAEEPSDGGEGRPRRADEAIV